MAENITLSQEILCHLNKRVRGGNIVVKLDMEKAYDRVKWSFLKKILGRFGFSSPWVKLVERCWSNYRFSVLINGESAGFSKSTRGLRSLPASRASSIQRALGMSRASSNLRYLGVLVGVWRRKIANFQPLIDKVDSKIRGWQSRCLSQAGKATLLQNVLSSILVHTLAAILVHSRVLKALERRFTDFFWGWTDGRKKLH
ncbi:uncharacterized protein LOC131254180 [Magnolia sinica]|uniref:uncharacterized protein LOC131254180 n=1 Tax=Magnolia sinica TaxID=86752 RepID=UPI002659DEE7|nr:uncharacterized protein LOC131254180 [Magnolia sinica]